MIEAKYSEAAVEVLDILNYTNEEDVKKIPQSFIKFLIDISNKNYKVRFNHEQPIAGFNLKKQTKELLGFIYITWWSDKEEYKKYKNIIRENNIKKERVKEAYNTSNAFRNKEENKLIQSENVIEKDMVEYKKENVFKKFLDKIFNLFNITKGDKI